MVKLEAHISMYCSPDKEPLLPLIAYAKC
jgi:hypothetical protein